MLAAIAVVGGVVAAGGVALAARGARAGRGHGQQADAALRGQDRPWHTTTIWPPNGNSPLRPTPPRQPRDSPRDAHGRRAVRQRLELGGPSTPSAPSRGPPLASAPAMAVQLGLVGRVGGLHGSALRDGRQSGSNAGHSYGIGNIVAGAVTYALQSNQAVINNYSIK